MGHKSSYDHMFLDGLQDAYQGELMGVFGQQIADKLEFTRQNMDEWASLSVGRAMQAQQQKLFDDEMVSVSLRNGEVLDYDEQPPSIKPEKIPQLKPAFAKNGSITAANSSAISDGAAALVVMDGQLAQQKGLKPLAIIKGMLLMLVNHLNLLLHQCTLLSICSPSLIGILMK